MFTTDQPAIGIQVGTAIATMVMSGRKRHGEMATVRYRDLWGLSNDKRHNLWIPLPTATWILVFPRWHHLQI